MIKVSQAILSLIPNAKFGITNNDYSTLQWNIENDTPKPTKEEVEAEAVRLQKEWEDTEYQRLRSKEYPDFKEYLDGLVKGDTEQMQAYINACLAVKAKYPKPDSVE
jgi:hypothetical protein